MAKAKSKNTSSDFLKAGFEKSGMDNDKGMKENSPADKKADNKQFKAFKGKFGKSKGKGPGPQPFPPFKKKK